jgi:uncharacterized protein
MMCLETAYMFAKLTIMAENLRTLRERRSDILDLAAKHGASNVRVFGSVARGEADGASDIDFLVTFDPKRSLFDLGALIVDLEDLLESKVDVAPDDWLRPKVRERAVQDAVPL